MLVIKSLCRYLTATLFALVSTSALAFNINYPSIVNVASGYGFLVGQEISVQLIANRYPDLAKEAYLAQARFNLKFPDLKQNQIAIIQSSGVPEVDQLLEQTKAELQAHLSRQSTSRLEALRFIDTVNQRAKGEIESPFLESFLMIQYDDKPYQEITDGFYNQFSSSALSQAKAVNLTIKIPKSWQQQEASSPDIIKKWISQDGTGLDTIMLTVKELPEPKVDAKTVEALYNNDEVNELLPDEMILIDKGSPITLDELPGYWIHMGAEMQYPEFTSYVEQTMYVIFYDNKMIGIQCATANTPDNKSQVELRARSIQPLCATVANTLVISELTS
ncbi:hypothetical protein [Psychrobacter sp. FDAARGOS_221]|uniref:hypothetical protein n=1 Tax=Psychrobacter sp. FDAARGOS_221 TaxID=1975705 RepID=UPI000BB53B63|nr:hypothetical protein [Psychrobacter sp. FDAARGOS_221]PNK61080.1 hypothetical protein A6J60_009475 [Psychrobacter sp. FDAARGOS_221]